jgi:hypothetical protein
MRDGAGRKDESKSEWLAKAKHAHETALKAVNEGMHDVAQEWMNKAAECRAQAAKSK